ncbi:MAG: hypothetical protein HC906_06455 [Bacteroidales bacterium]|nr:hypothetical protein [Bacteroidales bacterium]
MKQIIKGNSFSDTKYPIRRAVMSFYLNKTLFCKPVSCLKISAKMQIISNPVLWSPEKPYLYRFSAELIDVLTNRVHDKYNTNIGFRWFTFDPVQGFYLNGNKTKIMGVSRHHDYPGLGNALTNDFIMNDIALIKEMGANFLRVAHYPQNKALLDACDKIGLFNND